MLEPCIIVSFWLNLGPLRAKQHEAGTTVAESGFTFSPAELCLFTKVPCNKCEQLVAAGRPVATLPTPFFLQLPLTSYLEKKEKGPCMLCRLQLPEVQFGSETAVRAASGKRHLWISKHRMKNKKKRREGRELKARRCGEQSC